MHNFKSIKHLKKQQRLGIILEKRPPIPSSLKRRVLVEAGHRCAIPTCRALETEIAHINPYRIVKKHDYENLIALCPTCHTRADKGEIDRESLRMYKRILQRLTDRYSKFELDVLDELRQGHPVVILGSMILLIKTILDEGLVELPIGVSPTTMICCQAGNFTVDDNSVSVLLTEKGAQFISDWLTGKKSMMY